MEKMIVLFGGHISNSDRVWRIRPSTLTLTPELFVPGDPSSAAFFLCAAVVAPESRVTARSVLLNPTRTGFLTVLERMGADIKVEEKGREPEPWGDVTVSYSPHIRGVDISGAEIPGLVDEVPILALVATQAAGVTVFREAGELRIKETDRLKAITDQLNAMGADIRIQGDNLVISGPTRLASPDRLDAYGDHRMAMTLRLAGLLADATPYITAEESVAVSYPGFQEDLRGLFQ
jgi:3-phosphoshikimate 1-carboxyvinyltransferase